MPHPLVALVTCFVLLGIAGTPAMAETPRYSFDFPDETTLLPATVSAAEVLTIASEREGNRTHGVILLVGGRAIYFSAVDTHPLRPETTAADAFAALGK